MLLCDYATVSEGKLFVSGGGWSVASPGRLGGWLALLLGIPWRQANTKIHLSLTLCELGGSDVEPRRDEHASEFRLPVRMEAEVEVGRPPGLPDGVTLDAPMAFPMPPVELGPGRQFEWVLKVDNEGRPEWRYPFMTRTA